MARILQSLTILTLLCCGMGAGCAGKGEEKSKKTATEAAAAGNRTAGNAATREVILGEIAYVDRDAGFVLLRSTPSAGVKPGAKLESRDWAGSLTGNLVLGSERKRQFLIANIADGTPSVGDQIHYEAKIVVRREVPRHDIGTRSTREYSRKSGLKRG